MNKTLKKGLIGAACIALGYTFKRGIKLLFDALDARAQMKRAERAKKEADKQAEEQNKNEELDPEIQLKKQAEIDKQEVFKMYGLLDRKEPQREDLNNDRINTTGGHQPLVGPLINRGDLCIVASVPGIGKSLFATQIAIEVAKGIPSQLFSTDMGHQPPQRVLYFDKESADEDRYDRYGQLGYINNLDYYPKARFDTVYQFLRFLYNKIESNNLWANDLTIFLDTLNAMFLQKSYSDHVKLFDALLKLCDLFAEKGSRLTVVIVHHTVKDPKHDIDLSDVGGKADLMQMVTKGIALCETGQAGTLLVKVIKSNSKSIKSLTVKRVNTPYVHYESIHNNGSNTTKNVGRPNNFDDVVNLYQQGKSKREIALILGKDERTVRNHLKKYRSLNSPTN